MKRDIIKHSGVAHDKNPPGRGSGRFEWGSGENPYQHQESFLNSVHELKRKGFSQNEIAATLMGIRTKVKNGETVYQYDKEGNPIYCNSTDLRAQISTYESELRRAKRDRALKVYNECNGNKSEAARRLGIRDTSLALLLKDEIAERNDRYQNTADYLRKKVDEKGVVNIGQNTELFMGVTGNTKKVAVAMLEKEGYVKQWVPYEIIGTKHRTSAMVLAKPGMTYSEISAMVKSGQCGTIQEFSPDEGKTWYTPEFPKSIDSKRVYVRYKEDGGELKDGVIELRRGVEDISLDKSQYAQVRIAVDGTHYMKGMAMYGDFSDIPKGYDIIYNTNKKKGTPVLGPEGNSVMKLLKINKDTGEVDRENPFGALIKTPKEVDGVLMAGGQRHYIDQNGDEQLSPINKLRDEGDWSTWSKNLSSQFLSKQPIKLIRQQLDLTIDQKQAEFDQIKQLTNPVIKSKLLEQFANSCDADAADLPATGFKNQSFQVLLPIPGLKNNEIYAPQYKDGETIALIRYPHAGPFEIPVLKNNKKSKIGKETMFDAKDAVGINLSVAEQLSGADFDGDTALVIPLDTNNINISHTEYLPGLKNWSPKEYKLSDGDPKITHGYQQKQMGIVTNLIADMTAQGATPNQIERAVKHSMVVIDSEKHHLDYKRSYKDSRIDELKREYQKNPYDSKKYGGASTIFTKAGSEAHINERKEITDIKKMTPEEVKAYQAGKKIYRDTGKTKYELVTDESIMTPEEKKRYSLGLKVYRPTDELLPMKVKKMDLVDDAMDLVYNKNNPKEVAYANYANSLKSMANEARKIQRNIGTIKVDKTATKTYKKEVDSLMNKLRIAKMNSPKEAQAQLLANYEASKRIANDPSMDYEHRMREKAMCLTRARAIVGAKKIPINIEDSEWEAIQANALSTNRLKAILDNTDQEKFKQRATPKGSEITLSSGVIARIKAMKASGLYTQDEIANALRISSSTVSKYLN